uniref:Xrn1 N-terminal domain-containing protein n=1 Tax=viral metagenome TaxID=1070528 RepID=A0A6C0EW55_9ZZZZ
MGIPSYFSYIVKNHTKLIKKLRDNKVIVNNLYLDCNSIIYDAVHNLDFSNIVESDIDTIIRSVCNKIDEYILNLKPDNNIFIAFDGVAPVAKLDQQRSRRYKSLYQNKISKSIFKDTKPDPWNTTAITPGTIFMNKLNDKIRCVFNNTSKYNVQNIILSLSDKYGEGEHKIFEFIRKFPEQHKSKNTIIYGLDADLIMLSINHLPISNNIYLFRETPHFIKSISSELDPNESYIIDIPELAKLITLDMNNGEELNTKQQKNRIYDYILLCFFLGNDFMPHFPSVNIRTGGIDKMLNAYKATIGGTNENLYDGKQIIWKNIRKLVQFLANMEEENMKLEAKLRDRREKNILPDETPEEKYNKFDLIPIYERKIEKYINPYKDGWKNRYYKQLFNIEIDEVRKKQICLNYLEGIEWTMKYYTVGCPDWRWSYSYMYPPLLSDLIHYIPYFNTEFISNNPPNPVSELVQLCYVLPKQSLTLLPSKLYNNLIRHHSDWYSTDCEFIWAYCRYFWESHVVLPNIEINELEYFVNNNK